jgi:hypothetical protein
MGVGVWEPGGGSAKEFDRELLNRFLAVAVKVATQDEIQVDQLKSADLATSQWVMGLAAADWAMASELPSDDLVLLVRFFTLVENQVSGWEAGNKSPVIPLVKALKVRDEFTAELRKWIKTHTDNRYLPYGSAL